mgnify:CR=1 FL=1
MYTSGGLPTYLAAFEEKMFNEHLFALLSIANCFDFDAVRAFAITALDANFKKFSLMERLTLTDQFNVTDWLKVGYLELCARKRAVPD